MMSSSSSSPNSSASLSYHYSLSSIAYGCRYRAPLKNALLTFSRYIHHRRLIHRRSPAPATPFPLPVHLPLLSATSTISSCCCRRLPSPNFFTGNSLFSRMERFLTGNGIVQNKAMVEHLMDYGIISSMKVAEVMGRIDRAHFVPEGTEPYADHPMLIGYNATISAPHMHAMCLELLEKNLQPGMRALDVGSGTGYLTACFAIMVGPQGRAVGVEHIPELVDKSIKNIQNSAAAPLLEEGSLLLHAGDGRLGWPEFAPYNAIHVGAAAPEIPQALVDQLKPGGRLVIPVGNVFQALQIVDKNMDGTIIIRTETSVRYVPLTSREAQLRGY